MTTDVRTTLNLPAEIAAEIDNYWHGKQLRSRNEAIRELLCEALTMHMLPRIPPWARKPAKDSRR
jgi:metal-responsive CopG/Arc/MetJ family transcriptional regulator